MPGSFNGSTDTSNFVIKGPEEETGPSGLSGSGGSSGVGDSGFAPLDLYDDSSRFEKPNTDNAAYADLIFRNKAGKENASDFAKAQSSEILRAVIDSSQNDLSKNVKSLGNKPTQVQKPLSQQEHEMGTFKGVFQALQGHFG